MVERSPGSRAPASGLAAIAAATDPGAAFRACLWRHVRGCPGLDFEISLRMSEACREVERVTAWLPAVNHEDHAPIAALLADLDAPAVVRALQAANDGSPYRQGVGCSVGRGSVEARFYRHTRPARGGVDRYESVRWRPDGALRRSRYTFTFLPEDVNGRGPLAFTPPELRPFVEQILGEQRLHQISGFWLREGEDGVIEQLDLAFPWQPRAGTIPGFPALLAALVAGGLSVSSAESIAALHIRHLALGCTTTPSIAVHAAAAAPATLPESYGELIEVVSAGARARHEEIERDIFAGLPALPGPEPPGETNGAPDLDEFYGGSVARWQAVLGSSLHYHAGLFDDADADPDDRAMDAAVERAVTELYPFLPPGGRVYDVGCGWGGPLALICRDLGGSALGITISRGQYRHVVGMGLPVRLGDAERTLPPGRFDAALLLESFTHIRDKSRLLRVLRAFCGRLVMRVNCQDGAPPGDRFGGSMAMLTSADLRALLVDAGWTICHWQDRRSAALPSIRAWHRRLANLAESDDPHLETLREWCCRVAPMIEAWGRSNPLVEVMAQ
jgi:hypothetical protein